MDTAELASALNAKVAAMEIVLIALMRAERDNPKFWERLDKVMGESHAILLEEGHRHVTAQADQIQNWLDTWRSIAGPDGRQAPP